MRAKTYYKEKLKDPRWQKKRLKILERDSFHCRMCYADNKTLHVHHCHYWNYETDPWDYPAEMLITLCEDCHKKHHSCSLYPVNSVPWLYPGVGNGCFLSCPECKSSRIKKLSETRYECPKCKASLVITTLQAGPSVIIWFELYPPQKIKD